MDEELYAKPEQEEKDSKILGIRLPLELKNAFQALCESKGTNMSSVIRKFIERQIKEN